MSPSDGTKARDLMRREVATLSADDSIETALALFEEARISGAPVVAGGKLVGMLTRSDVSRSEHLREGPRPGREHGPSGPDGAGRGGELDLDEDTESREDYAPEVLGRERVADWMTSGIVSVPADASLQTVCKAMVEHEIHRVCVTEDDRLVGLITSFDVVRLLARRRKAPAPARKARNAR